MLLQKLATDFKVTVRPEDFDDLLEAPDDPSLREAVFDRLSKHADEAVPGFSIKPRTVVGNFSYFKLPMVRDLELNEDALIASDLVAAIAGDEEARRTIREQHAIEVDPAMPDWQPPFDEYLVLDADSTQSHAVNTVVAGSSLVIKGPPGTGKSQTIANLIATLSARGAADALRCREASGDRGGSQASGAGWP